VPHGQEEGAPSIHERLVLIKAAFTRRYQQAEPCRFDPFLPIA
jgi:hypothetical protein